jgi:hypothetical protein
MQTHALPVFRSQPLRSQPLRFRPPAGGSRPWHRQRHPSESSRAASRPEVQAQPVLLRRARLVALAVGGFLLPWSALLAVTLPATAQAQHWALAEAGCAELPLAVAAWWVAIALTRQTR